MSDAALEAWLEAARHAYAYLFFTTRAPSERAFENRQTQVRDYYNYAVQQVVERLFVRAQQAGASAPAATTVGRWRVNVDLAAYRLPGDGNTPRALFAASSLRFGGLRSTYRRDGFGADLVAEVDPAVVGDPAGLAVQQALPAPKDPQRPLPTFSGCRMHRPRSCCVLQATRWMRCCTPTAPRSRPTTRIARPQ